MANGVGTEFPTGSRIVLWRREGGWSVFAHYPLGHLIPATAMKFDNRLVRNLDAAYERISVHHHEHGAVADTDHSASGHAGPIPIGALIDFELQDNGWKMNGTDPHQGFFGRLGPFHSIREAFTYIQVVHGDN